MDLTELLDLVVDAHGGRRRWAEISRFRAAASITGAILAMKGKAGLLDDVVLEGNTRATAEDQPIPAGRPLRNLGTWA